MLRGIVKHIHSGFQKKTVRSPWLNLLSHATKKKIRSKNTEKSATNEDRLLLM